jgi:protein SCO1
VEQAVKGALLPFVLLAAGPAPAALSPAELAQVGSTPPEAARLPALSFIDQRGAPYTLAPGDLPTVLLFADYSCRHICGPGITLTAGALHDAGLVPARDYRMIVIGMDQDGPALARKLVAERLHGLPREAAAMTLLTGGKATVTRAETALGYHAVYDAQADQFAHDAAIYVFAPGGALSALLPETASTSAQLSAAIAGAQRDAAYVPPPPRDAGSGLLGRISAICYGLASAHGVYARPIVWGLRAGGVVICLMLAGLVAWMIRRGGRRSIA